MIASQFQAILSAILSRFDNELQEIRLLNQGALLLDFLFGKDLDPVCLPGRSLLYLLWKTYGDEGDLLKNKLSKLSALCDCFLKLYGDGPVNALRAPARINILGEHIDYVSYLPTASLPFGSREHDMIMLFRASEGGRVRGASKLEDCPAFDFDLGEGPSVSDWETFLYSNPSPAPHWENYVKGAVYFARAKYGEQIRCGFDFVVDSSIPACGGASSSSALTVLAGAAIRQANQIKYSPDELARDSSQAEWHVGTRGGAMDHITICLSRRQRAVHISYSDQQIDLLPLPACRFRWVTFFSHAADKGREVMLEYNERAAVSRIIIPAIIESWSRSRPSSYNLWQSALEAFQVGAHGAIDELERLLNELPSAITIAEVEREYPEAFRRCREAFPALVSQRRERPMRLRDRALHHLGETRRVAAARRALDEVFDRGGGPELIGPAMRTIGDLLNQSHNSLRNLYEVCTPEVNRLVEIITSDPLVYGARLMGGGFGGNVLALTTKDHVCSLINRVQSEFYNPAGREGLQEGLVMISTPGEGLSVLDVETALRAAIEHFNALWWESDKYRDKICSMLDSLEPTGQSTEVWPVIVAAGRGARARSSGLDVPKPLALVAGVPAIVHVLRAVKASGLTAYLPIVIVSPETEPGIRQALSGEEVIYVQQPEARGTGDAVLCAYRQMQGFGGRALIIWGTQPVIRVQTVRRVLKLAEIFAETEMILPTVVKHRPYAPLLRDHLGRVRAARETHLERAQTVRFGETNIGLFVLKSEAMFEALLELKRRYWREAENRYDRPGGELGFPNQLIRSLTESERGVLASPIADRREEQGIKHRDDIARCERFIKDLNTVPPESLQ